MNDELNLFDKYRLELEEDLKLDDFSIKDTQLKLPGIKHKWVSRLIQQKIEREKLKKLRNEGLDKLTEQIRTEAVVKLSDKSILLQAENHELIRKIDAKINDTQLLIDYLEKVEKICAAVSFDIKNIIDLHKLELQ